MSCREIRVAVLTIRVKTKPNILGITWNVLNESGFPVYSMFAPEQITSMNAEFIKIGPDTAKSTQGFTVVFHPAGGVDYSDASGAKIRVDTELYVKPFRYILYARSKDLRTVTSSQADEILANIQRALGYLGRLSEISRD